MRKAIYSLIAISCVIFFSLGQAKAQDRSSSPRGFSSKRILGTQFKSIESQNIEKISVWDEPYLIDPRQEPRISEKKRIKLIKEYENSIDPRCLQPPKFLTHYRTDEVKSRNLSQRRSGSSGPYAIPEPKTVLLIIDDRLDTYISTHLNQYIADLELDGWTVVSLIYVSGDIWDIKDEIIVVDEDPTLPELDGVVLIGRIPAPRYYSKGPGNPHWNGYCAYTTPNIYMFFYGNLKEDTGYYPNGTNLVYHVKPPGVDNWSPDIWVSIIRGNWLPILGGGVEFNEDTDVEAEKINNYFEKNHRVRTGDVPRYKTGLSVSAFGDEQATAFQEHLENLTGGDVDKYAGSSLPSVAWTENYDWACLASHGSPTWFLGVTAENFYNNVCNIKFVNVCACKCGNLDYGQSVLGDCVAQGMVMDPDGDIVTTFSGADLNGGMGGIDEFIASIASGNTIGKAYADWEKNTWAGWNAHSGDGEHGITWPIERFATIIFGDGTFYYEYGAPTTPTPPDYKTPIPTTTPTPSPPPVPPDEEPIAYWKFDEGDGTTAADSIGSNVGTIQGAVWVDGVRGKALEFDGISNYVDILPVKAELPYNMSISAWIKLYSDSSPSGWGIISSGYNSSGPYWMVEIDTQNQVRIYTPTKYNTAYSQLLSGQWYHIAWTTDTQAGRVYINGELVETFMPVVSNPAISGSEGAIGRGYGSRVSFDGIIDEVRVYDNTLLENEVAYLYYYDKPNTPTTPSATPTPSLTPTPPPSVTPTPSLTPSPTPSWTPTVTLSPTQTTSATPTPSITPTPSTTLTPSPTNTSLTWHYDYDGDGTSDIGIFRGSTGLWAIRKITRVYFGGSSDITVPGDYDGDGTTNIGIFRPSSGLWALRNISRIYFGSVNDLPVQGDFEGCGTWRLGVFRQSSGLWAICDVTRVYFGGSSDINAPGDYNGDGTVDIGIYRPSTGLWALRNVSRTYFGATSDLPIPSDYDGDGSCEIGIFRETSGLWEIRGLTRICFGQTGDWICPADFNGDFEDDISIFRDTSGLWAVKDVTRVYFGSSGDQPVTK